MLVVALEIQDSENRRPHQLPQQFAVAFNLGTIARLGSLPRTLNETLTRNAFPWGAMLDLAQEHGRTLLSRCCASSFICCDRRCCTHGSPVSNLRSCRDPRRWPNRLDGTLRSALPPFLTRLAWRFHAAQGLCSSPSRFPWLRCPPPKERPQLLPVC